MIKASYAVSFVECCRHLIFAAEHAGKIPLRATIPVFKEF